MVRLLGNLLECADNKFDLVLEVSKLAKQIKEETKEGLPGLINLIGIESPGLTSSLAIARKVKTIVA